MKRNKKKIIKQDNIIFWVLVILVSWSERENQQYFNLRTEIDVSGFRLFIDLCHIA
jgi:hypothetical protein